MSRHTDRTSAGCLAAAFIAFTTIALVFQLGGCHVKSSEGDRIGVITKLSRHGAVWKTWEGEAILGSTDVPGVGSNWNFTVEDSGPIEAVRTAMESGHKVKMHYIEFLKSGKAYGNTDYRITQIEVIAK